ncbi:EamA family transporter [Apilactobacillus timberlakei]|uniref:DMT family transporter n=1 Tax=Apilactobacillus timberlakei TaxID=2008380 RepID=UPI00112E6E47|nr:DMT family transporter [Apilactobacillus timberlakei]TPR18834.1 EamA family transporter [Apilactobacillus timberlakei]TPR21001.1 EamA family transporter [Apilactobacillus timberlakei]TPR23652.1 EamA family transporter [Apilactobacillus timberlakei]TPR25003.1 EamA family transporter [Apilactobacillus timberlakei]
MEKQNKTSENVVKGIFWSSMASTLWGISGVIMQFVAQNEAVPTTWFISVRTLFAGILLLIIGASFVGKHIFDVFKSKESIIRLFIYAIFGLAVNMSTFYVSIQEGNASTATILQYLAPVFIVLYGLVFLHKKPLKADIISFLFALVGVFMIITKGSFSELSVPMIAVVFGLFSAISAAIYYSVPKPLTQNNSPFVVLGWGTLIAGIGFNLYHPFWTDAPKITSGIVFGIGGVILIGTIFAFSSVLYSLKFAPSEVSSIVDAVEPVVTIILSIIVFKQIPSFFEALGAVIIIVSIYFLQRSHQKRAKKAPDIR